MVGNRSASSSILGVAPPGPSLDCEGRISQAAVQGKFTDAESLGCAGPGPWLSPPLKKKVPPHPWL